MDLGRDLVTSGVACLLTQLLGIPGRRYPANAAVRPNLVVVPTPCGNLGACLAQALEPVLIEALVAELAVEALDVAVLHGTPWLDENVADMVLLGPGDEGPAGELRAVIGSDRGRVAPESRCLVQQPGDVQTADAVVHCNLHAFVAEVVGHGQALDAPPVGQAVADEVHAPHLVDALGDVQGRALHHRALGLLALANRQIGRAVEPVHPLVIDAREVVAQQVVHAPVAKAPAHMRDLDDLVLQRLGLCAGHRWVPVAVSA